MSSSLQYNDEVLIYFKTEESSPYRLFGKYRDESDEYVRIEGTLGDQIGRDIFVPKSEIKMIERIAERKEV